MRGPEIYNVSFHGIGTPGTEREPGEHDYWVTEDSFLRILDECAQRSDVRLSFDDGNASDARIALPALRERSLTADFFPVAERLGTPGNLDVDDVRELVAAGMGVGTHGARHRKWTGLPESDLGDELEVARVKIAEVAGHAVDRAACPFGAYDRNVLRRLRELGYQRVFTSDRRPAHEDEWLQARYSVTAKDDVASFRAAVLAPRSAKQRARDTAVGTIKRWR